MADLTFVLAIAAAGGLGAVIRALLSNWKGWSHWGVLASNTLAGLGVGLVWASGLADGPLAWLAILLFYGLFGGLSTFSAVVADSGDLFRQRQYSRAFGNLFLNLLAPFTAMMTVGLVAAFLLR